jgi:hypothetical protein
MGTELATDVVIWHEDDLEDMTASPRPGVRSKPRDFIDRDHGVAFRVSTTTKTEGEERSFRSPRHRHTFDQIRFYYRGKMRYGTKEVYGDGDMLYIPGGTYYGPMEFADTGAVKHLNFQFSGLSGIPYYGTAEFAPARARLEQRGRFENGAFRGNDGRNQDGWEALLEETIQRPVEYPNPSLTNYVVVRSANLAWHEVPDHPGVLVKYLGHFTEVGPNALLYQLADGASLPGGTTGSQEVWTLWDGAAVFDDAPQRTMVPVSGMYAPRGVHRGGVRASADGTVLLRVQFAPDGELLTPSPAI